MIAKTEPGIGTADREIVIERVLDAPRELVWRAWTDPRHVVKWWGPEGFTTTIEAMDVRPGGIWKHVMHGPDGTDYPNLSTFIEVDEPERIVYSHGGSRKGGPGANFVATWTFEPHGAKTRLTMRLVFPSAEARDFVVNEFGAIEGGEQTLSRLGEYLTTLGSDHEIVTTRLVDFPREQVYEAWTDPALLARWWGPHGFTNTFEVFELRPGGDWRFVMRGPDGKNYPNHSRFVEIVPQERIVFDHLSDHKFRVTAIFIPEESKTRVTFRMGFDSTAECDRVRSFAVGKNEENLDRLEAVLRDMDSSARPIVIRITRRYHASAEQVFDAWVDLEKARRWFLRTPQGELVRAEMDARVGGRWIMVEQRGEVEAYHGGEYLEIDRPRRLVFTFAVDPELTDAGRVEIDIKPSGTGCELTLTQEMSAKFREYEERSKRGWATLLDALERALS